MDLLIPLLGGLPSGILVLYASLGLQGKFLPARRLLLWGALLGLTVTVYRLPGIPGLHVPLFVFTQILLVRFLGRGPWGATILISLVVNLSIPIGEGLLVVPFFTWLGFPIKTVLMVPHLRLLGTWIANIPLLIMCTAVLVRQRRRRP